MFGTSGRTSIGRHAMDRHSTDTLACRFAELQTQKNRLKGRFQYLLQKEEMVPVGGLEPPRYR
ncbi:hypothetical protein D7031_07790 [Alteromonas sp. BL110]|nr:hypothetical protein D7031_07790 [Alteromonas sp. BL110]